jgi:glycosyltransferase involved in cell wall biosynthesis
MNILWIPHNSWGMGRHQRDQYFIDRLSARHSIHVLTWSDYLPHTLTHLLDPRTHLQALRSYAYRQSGCVVHHVPRVPGVLNRFSESHLGPDFLNRALLVRSIRRIIRRERIDVVVTAQTLGNARVKCPLVFDYVDSSGPLSGPDQECLRAAAHVLCASEFLRKKAAVYSSNVSLLSNGADLRKMRSGNGFKVREQLGLATAKVISLIGLTFSPEMYFLESIKIVRRKYPAAKCLLVGNSSPLRRALNALHNSEDFIYAGAVRYEEVQDYFAASDVGMYPGDYSEFFQAASPIKLFEYTAAGKPAVSSMLNGFAGLNWSNLIFTQPTAQAFAEGIARALEMRNAPVVDTAIEQYDWDTLSCKLEETLTRCHRDFGHSPRPQPVNA